MVVALWVSGEGGLVVPILELIVIIALCVILLGLTIGEVNAVRLRVLAVFLGFVEIGLLFLVGLVQVGPVRGVIRHLVDISQKL